MPAKVIFHEGVLVFKAPFLIKSLSHKKTIQPARLLTYDLVVVLNFIISS